MDLDAIKSRLNQLQNTQTNAFWKPQPGKSQIRIVPYLHDKNNPFSELFFHYSLVPNKTVLSPLSYGRPDPVQQFADKLKSTGNKDEWIQGKRIEPKMRTFVPVVVRGEESEGVKFWGFGKTVYQELLGIIADPDYGDISDATTGRDIVVERQTPAEAGNQYGKTTIRVKPNVTALSDDSNLLQRLLDEQPDIKELYQEPTFDELKSHLSNFLNPSDSTEETTEKEPEMVATEGSSNVEDDFDKLFNS
jgi:hypothetical protein|tara:strand:+ start:763 stop:1506 length:744 start_codon:yes stop_codon:yes gene_type:complete